MLIYQNLIGNSRLIIQGREKKIDWNLHEQNWSAAIFIVQIFRCVMDHDNDLMSGNYTYIKTIAQDEVSYGKAIAQSK